MFVHVAEIDLVSLFFLILVVIILDNTLYHFAQRNPLCKEISSNYDTYDVVVIHKNKTVEGYM